MKWVAQTNLGKDTYWQDVRDACNSLGFEFEGIEVIPFSGDLPEVPANKPAVFYGSTRLVTDVYRSQKWNPGVFFDEDNFRVSSWMKHIPKDLILNGDAEILPLKDAADLYSRSGKIHDKSEYVFVRPDKDLKEFSGETMTRDKLRDWFELVSDGKTELDPDTLVAVSKPWHISKEWRLFIVDKEVVSGSQYRVGGHLCQDSYVPEPVIRRAEHIANIWTPAPVCVMDICQSNELYLVEFNCFNSSGFYYANVNDIVKEISDFAKGP